MHADTAGACVIGFAHADGRIIRGTAERGSLMELALELGVPGIEGQCGGYLACGTCHIHVPDAWIEHSKTVKGYEVSFTKIFYRYQPLRSVATITEEIMQLERETEGLLNDIIA